MKGTDKPNINPQPHLGRPKEVYKPEQEMGGYLSLAKVITVHHKRNTVDVQIIKTKDLITSSATNEGKFGAKILVSTAHFNKINNTGSGVVEPIQEGQLVILAFLDGLKNEPIILGSVHDTWITTNNILTDIYPLHPDDTMYDKREALKYKRVYPSQGFYTVDGLGGVEYSLPSKTFLKIDTEYYSNITDDHLGTDHKDLEEKDPFHNLDTRSAKTVEEMNPVSLLFVHRSNFEDSLTTWSKVFIGVDGEIRVTRDNRDDKLSYIELSSKGNFKVRRQLDSPNREQGNNYSEISIDDSDGNIVLERCVDGETSKVTIDGSGNLQLKHKSGSTITFDSAGNISVSCTTFTVNGRTI